MIFSRNFGIETTLALMRVCLLLFAFLASHLLNARPVSCQLTFTEAQVSGPNIVRIPFSLTGAVITLQARVAGETGNFFFDTGASTLLLHDRYFTPDRKNTFTASTGITGEVNKKGEKAVDSLIISEWTLQDLRADVIDLMAVETSKKTRLLGIIGYEVFRDFEVIFDYEAGLLVLVGLKSTGEPIEAIPYWEYQPTGEFPVKMSAHVAKVQLTFGKTRLWFGIDSGAEQNLLSTGMRSKFLNAHFATKRRVKLRGMGGETVEVLAGVLSGARLDTVAIAPMATLLSNMDQINEIYRDRLAGILGYEFLRQRITGINFIRRKLTFYLPGNAGP